MIKGEVDIITLGCAKNLVDSEALAQRLLRRGYTCRHDPAVPQGEYVVVNTCGFIRDAKEESIDTILRLVEMKKRGQIGALFVMGCLAQRYKMELGMEIPEVDAYYGKFDYRLLVSDLPAGGAPPVAARHSGTWRRTPKHYAYVKISEGCDRRCAFCAIPIMTGHHKSRPQEEILSEVRQLAQQGVKEIQVIAQELTYYGMDLDGKRHIAELIAAMSDIPGIAWIRLHYAYPNQFPLALLDVMRERDNVCRYLDIAFQHASDHLLSAMQRHFTKAETVALINTMRARVPGIHLRTTFMVGFPGETDDDFEELVAFAKDMRFERMGAFMYSEEEGTYAAEHYKDFVPAAVKQQRLDTLMAVQQEISAEIEAQNVGKEMTVIIDRHEGEYYVGRTEFSSPEVDPEVLIADNRRLTTGKFYKVRITGSAPFDLYGEVLR